MISLNDPKLLDLFAVTASEIDVPPPPTSFHTRSAGERNRRAMATWGIASAAVGALFVGGGYWLTSGGFDSATEAVVSDNGSQISSSEAAATSGQVPEPSCEGPEVIVDFGNRYSNALEALRSVAIEPGAQIRMQTPPSSDENRTAQGLVLGPDERVLKLVYLSSSPEGWTVSKIRICNRNDAAAEE